MSKVEILGSNEIIRKLGLLPEQWAESCQAAVYAQALALDELINRNNMVPVKTGALRRSHYVTLPVLTSNGWTCEIGYGAPYAAEVHERGASRPGGARYSGHWQHGTPQWMRRGLALFAPGYAERLQKQLTAIIAHGRTMATYSGIVPTSPQFVAGRTTEGPKANESAYSSTQKRKLYSLAKRSYTHVRTERTSIFGLVTNRKEGKVSHLAAIQLVGKGKRSSAERKFMKEYQGIVTGASFQNGLTKSQRVVMSKQAKAINILSKGYRKSKSAVLTKAERENKLAEAFLRNDWTVKVGQAKKRSKHYDAFMKSAAKKARKK